MSERRFTPDHLHAQHVNDNSSIANGVVDAFPELRDKSLTPEEICLSLERRGIGPDKVAEEFQNLLKMELRPATRVKVVQLLLRAVELKVGQKITVEHSALESETQEELKRIQKKLADELNNCGEN